MNQRPILLDLFCCQGGAGKGYDLAGFTVVGVDNKPQPRYPFAFIQADALEYLQYHGHEYDAIHASPPCQHFSTITRTTKSQNDHPNLIPQVRQILEWIDRPWVIENVVGAPLVNPIMLCGAMFPALRVYRHRLFESNIPLIAPTHPTHIERTTKCGRGAGENGWMSIAGHVGNVAAANAAMGCGWMSQKGIAQAIPPAYTEYIGKQLIGWLHGQETKPGAPLAGAVPAGSGGSTGD